MAKDELIDSRVSVCQCKSAVEALHNHQTKEEEKRQENELLPKKEQHIWLVLAVRKIYPEHKLKPFKMCVSNLFQGIFFASYVPSGFVTDRSFIR